MLCWAPLDYYWYTQKDKPFKLGAEARGRYPSTAPQDRRPKLVGLRWRSTRPTTRWVRSSGQQKNFLMETRMSTNSYGLETMQEQFVGWVQRRRSRTQRRLHKAAGQACRVTLPLHSTYDDVLSGCAAAPPDLRLLLDELTTLYPLREKMFKAFFKISLSSFTRCSSVCRAMYACLLMVSVSFRLSA